MLLEYVKKDKLKALERFLPADAKPPEGYEGRVIHLPTVFEGCGRVHKGKDWLPKLAIGHPKATVVGLQVGNGRLSFDPHLDSRNTKRVDVAGISWVKSSRGQWDDSPSFESRMPPIPNDAKEHITDKSLILFEANWERRPALDDPAVIEQLIGDLWVVKYTWDLTAEEKAALALVGL